MVAAIRRAEAGRKEEAVGKVAAAVKGTTGEVPAAVAPALVVGRKEVLQEETRGK